MHSRNLTGLVFLGFLAAVPAAADVTIVERQQPAGGGEASTTMVYLQESRIRVETNTGGRPGVIIFDGTRDAFYMVDSANRTYREMTKQDLEQMMGQVSGMMAQMQEQLKNMPPDQREAIQRMMSGRMGAMPTQQRTVYEHVRSGERVGQWTCDLYEGTRGGEKRWDICTVPPQALGLTADDFAVFQEMASFFEGMAAQLGEVFAVGTAEIAKQPDRFAGVPVLRVAYRDGQPGDRFELTEVRHDALEASLFQVPDGYTKEEMPTMPAGRMPR